MTAFRREPGLSYLSWNDWVAGGQQRSATGWLAEWLETSHSGEKIILVDDRDSEAKEVLLPGLLACCPDARVGKLSEISTLVQLGASVLALFPEEAVAEKIVDKVNPERSDLCISLWPGFDDLRMWLHAHGAASIPSGVTDDRGFLERIPAVAKVALQTPLDGMDDASGLRAGRGKSYAVSVLRVLHANDIMFSKQDLQLYAYWLGYRQRDVHHLSDYFGRIQNNKRVHAGEHRLRENIMEVWTAETELPPTDPDQKPM